MRTKLIHNLVFMSSGTLLGQVFVVAFSPLITRIYGPEAFGLQGLFLSMISIFSPLTNLRMHMAIGIAQTQVEADRVFSLGLQVALVNVLIMEALLLIVYHYDIQFLGTDKLGALIFLLPVALLMVSVQEAIDIRTARLEQFGLMAKVVAVQAFLANLGRAIGGWLMAPSASVLVCVTAFAPALHAFLLDKCNTKNKVLLSWLPWIDIRTLILQYRDFPLYRVPTDMLGAISQSIPILMLASLFSPSVAGYYVLARSVINLPLNIIGSAVGNVYFSRFAEMEREGKYLFPVVWKSTAGHLMLFGLPILLIAPIFPVIFAFVFGSEWRVSGEYAQWMSFWIAGMLTNIPSVRVLPVIGKQYIHLFTNIALPIAGAAAIVLSHAITGTPQDAVFWYSVAVATVYVLQISTYNFLAFLHDFRLHK